MQENKKFIINKYIVIKFDNYLYIYVIKQFMDLRYSIVRTRPTANPFIAPVNPVLRNSHNFPLRKNENLSDLQKYKMPIKVHKNMCTFKLYNKSNGAQKEVKLELADKVKAIAVKKKLVEKCPEIFNGAKCNLDSVFIQQGDVLYDDSEFIKTDNKIYNCIIFVD